MLLPHQIPIRLEPSNNKKAWRLSTKLFSLMNPFGIATRSSPVFNTTLRWCSVFVVAWFANIAPSIAAEQDTSIARINPTTVSARGKQSSLLTLKAFGRYAITVASSQGVALQSLDRMTGAGQIVGEAGKQDGRLDLFLDRGEYKILTHASAKGSGQAKLSAHAFRELHDRPPMLIEQRLERATLDDFEQRSYWLEIKEKRTVAIEAAGRHLADLRLWRDGTWLVNVSPQLVISQARADRPLQIARFTAQLEPGLYLVTAYGGPSQPWTEASDDKPFFLRLGIPTLGMAMRQQFTMGELGVERFLIPDGGNANPNFFRLELPVAGAANLQVAVYDEHDPFQSRGASASIDKRSLPPVAELSGVGGSGARLVTVTMEAGKPFILQYFNASYVNHFSLSGDYWLSSIHAGYAEDSIGASAILTRQRRNGMYGSYGPEEYVDARVLELGNTPWHRRFNLLDELTLFVKLPGNTNINVIGQGVKARYRFEPFLTSRPADYKTPPWQESGHTFYLDRGLYVLTVQPETKGILDLQLLPPGTVVQDVMSFLSKVSSGAKAMLDEPSSPAVSVPGEKLTPVEPVARFAETRLDNDTNYTMYLNRQPGVASGLVLRQLPIDLRDALPVTQRAGETLTMPVRIPEKGTLRAIAEDGRSLNITLDNGKKGAAIEVEAGQARATVKGTDAVQVYSLRLEPARMSSQTPLPPMPDATLAGLPKFPVITSGSPYYLDLKRSSSSDFKVQVAKPGLYRFETTGLLRTGGRVRTRVNPSMFSESENGVGRNFLIQRYLREGEYQLSVDTQGQTQGDLGVQVTRTEVVDGGELRAGVVARALLPSAQALAYRFHIAKRGTYHLQAIGLGRDFKLRLEDDDGWPQFAPVLDGDINGELAAGNYRLIVLPQTAEARVLTRLDPVAVKKIYTGHGPHRIALGSRIEHTWLEPAKGKTPKENARIPDQWEFDLPASADLSITLDSEMEATLVNVIDLKKPVAQIEAKRAWNGKVPAGRYRVQARHSRSNNHVPYTLQISAVQLVAGQSREVLAPAVIPVSVGTDGLVELQSFGHSDVRARLFDTSGDLVAQNDDRPDDWNFHIARRLSPGEYKLAVDPVNEQQASTTVSMLAPAEVAEKPLALGSNAEIKDDRVHVYPLTVPNDRNFLLVSAQSSDTVGLALEGNSGQGDSGHGWINLGTTLARSPYLALPLGAERLQSYRLRAWSADRRSLKVRVRAVAAALAPSSESQWLQGSVALKNVDEARDDLRVAMISMSRPGTFRIKGDLSGLQWSDTGLCAEQVGSNAVIDVSGKALWLISGQREAAALAAERLRLPVGENESLRIELQGGRVGSIDLQPNTQGPSLVLAQSRAGQPGIAMNAKRDPNTIGLVPGEAVAVALPGAAESAYVWNAASSGESLELDVRQAPLRRGSSKSLGMGASDGTIAARTSLPISLPGSSLRVRLTLSPMSAAVFLKRGTILSTHWSGMDALQETVLTDADELWLLNADTSETHYGVEIAPGTGEADAALKPGELLERNLSTAGRLRVPVEMAKVGNGSADQYRLHVSGNVQAMWLENGGRIASGNDIAIRDSGVLWLQHQPGILVAWLETPGVQGTKSISEWFKSLKETTVKPPQTVSLGGKSQILNFNPERVTMLHVRTNVPVVTHYIVEGQPPQTEAHLQGANINLFAPAGSSRLVLRAVGADSLSGVATVMASEVGNLSEGAGPEILLAPGSARLYSFEIKQQSQVGIGVRASSDVVHSVLYNERGAVQSQGVVQMPTLLPGRYYLTIEMPTDSAPVLVQPIVFGLKKPDTRPPFEILRRYVEGKDNDALLYVPPQPGAVTDAEAADKSTRPAKRRRIQRRVSDDESENTDESAVPAEEGESQPSDEQESDNGESDQSTDGE